MRRRTPSACAGVSDGRAPGSAYTGFSCRALAICPADSLAATAAGAASATDPARSRKASDRRTRGAYAVEPMPIDPSTHPGPVGLRVTDLDRARDFYSQALGLTEVPEGGDTPT